MEPWVCADAKANAVDFESDTNSDFDAVGECD